MNASLNLNFTQLLNITRPSIVTTRAPSGTPIVFDKSSLSTRFQDVTNVFVLTPVAVIGLILTTLKIIVLADKKLQGRMYQYFLLSSIFSLLVFLSSVFLALFRCGTLCPFGYNYYSKVFEQFFYMYAGCICINYGMLLDIFASFDRLLSFKMKQRNASERFLSDKVKCILLFILTIIINYPEYILTRSINVRARLFVSIDLTNLSNSSSSMNLTNETTTPTPSFYLEPLFVVSGNDLANLIPIRTSLIFFNLIRILTLLLILLFINILIGIKFREHMKKKRTISSSFSNASSLKKTTTIDTSQLPTVSTANETNATVSTRLSVVSKPPKKYEKSQQKVTKMTMIKCASTFFGYILHSFASILLGIFDNTTYNYYIFFSNLTRFTVAALDILLLYYFNSSFKARFRSKFAWLTSNN